MLSDVEIMRAEAYKKRLVYTLTTGLKKDEDHL